MSKHYNHRNLIVWQRAQELSQQMIAIVHRLPHSWANAIIARQVVTAATSIGANIAEGHGRFSPGAHGNHLEIAKGSAAETDSWSDSLRREGHITVAEDAQIHQECGEIMAILTSKILELERLEAKNVRRLREEPESYHVHWRDEETDAPPFPFQADDYIWSEN